MSSLGQATLFNSLERFPSVTALARRYLVGHMLGVPRDRGSTRWLHVYAVMDASGTFSEHALMASMFRMSQAGVKIANATMVVAEMLADWSGKYAHSVGNILAQRVPNFGLVFAGFAHQAGQRTA
jgi:hypothetical protein